MKYAIIGAGVSGLTVANLLKDGHDVKVFEKEKTPGGLIRCEKVEESLFHRCGGHVFNSRRQDVLDWFWGHFDREQEFIKADRNSVVFMPGGEEIPYPIENHIYGFPAEVQRKIIHDWLHLGGQPGNFEEFLQGRFGQTLYEMYFRPYNEKVWRRNLRSVSLSWLEGKLPMPTVEEMVFNNINQVKEKQFVHATFWYENTGGSQLIADRLSEGLTIRYENPVEMLKREKDGWLVLGEMFDRVVFCGNIKDLPPMLQGVETKGFANEIEQLEFHGTTTVFCEIAKNPYSWIYLPDSSYDAHRIICTGNFSPRNNAEGKMTATVEFTDYISEEDIRDHLKRIPLVRKYITHRYHRYTYPIQDHQTREMIKSFKAEMAAEGLYLTGRFADWEYYNMDVAMGAAMDLCTNNALF